MSASKPTALQLRSIINKEGFLQLSLVDVEIPEPKQDEVLVMVDASPINPSDLGLLLGAADMSTAQFSGSQDYPTISAIVPSELMKSMSARIDQSLPVGNEGAGEVVSAGNSDQAQTLLGKTVAILGGAMYAQYRCVKARDCLLLPDNTSAVEGASCFVNPLTALGMVETMKLEGHSALVHTAAGSNLGQMLNKICLNDGISLINIVRREAQENALREQGAKYVVDSSSDSFMEDLIEALTATKATLAFDATGGGQLAGQILTAMEVAANANMVEYSRYGSTVHKQVYIYGGLDRSPTRLDRNFGMAWGIGGWLLPPFLQRIGVEETLKLRQRVASEIKSTFKSNYTHEVSLKGALQLESLAVYSKMATGEKYLIRPNAD